MLLIEAISTLGTLIDYYLIIYNIDDCQWKDIEYYDKLQKIL